MALTTEEAAKLDSTLDACERAALATEQVLTEIQEQGGQSVDISAAIALHNTAEDAHADIRTAVQNAQKTADNKWTAVSASTSTAGIVKLNNTVTSTSTTQAATANAVRTAYNKAAAAQTATDDLEESLSAFTTNSDGSFSATATDGTDSSALVGSPDGGLTWDGKNVVRSVYGIAAGADGSISYGKCSTAKDVAEKEVTIEGFTLKAGTFFYVDFVNVNQAEKPTLNVNGTGAKAIYIGGYRANYTCWGSNVRALVFYTGTYYDIFSGYRVNSPHSMYYSIKGGTGNWTIEGCPVYTFSSGASSVSFLRITASNSGTEEGTATLDLSKSTGIKGTVGTVTMKAGDTITLMVMDYPVVINVSSNSGLSLSANNA